MRAVIAAYKYAGLQYGYQCFCGDRIGKYGQVADGECNMDCPVEYMQTCGGRWRNSVYETDYLGMSDDVLVIEEKIGRASCRERV